MPQCKSCEAQILFVELPSGRKMPVDAGDPQKYSFGTVVDAWGKVTTDGGHGWRPHWASCPGADKHRSQGDLFT